MDGQTAVAALSTVSIHVDSVETYNAAFRLLTEDFGLPAIYGGLLTPEMGSRRNYGGPLGGECPAGGLRALFQGVRGGRSSGAVAWSDVRSRRQRGEERGGIESGGNGPSRGGV